MQDLICKKRKSSFYIGKKKLENVKFNKHLLRL